MSNLFRDLLDTVEVQGVLVLDTKEVCDDLLADDFLLALGYNRKRNPLVRRATKSSGVDWDITEGTTELRVKTFGFGEDMSNGDNDIVVSSDADVLIKTNYVECIVSSVKSTSEFKEIANIKLADTSANAEAQFRGLSKGSLDLSLFDKQVGEEELFTKATEVVKWELENSAPAKVAQHFDINSNSDEYMLVLKAVMDAAVSLVKANAERTGAPLSLISSGETTDNPLYTDEFVSGLQQRVVELEGYHTKQASRIEELEESQALHISKVEELKASKARLQEDLDAALCVGVRAEDVDAATAEGETEDETEETHDETPKEAQRLLDAVADTDVGPRVYVGVVGEELFKIDTLKAFIGNCIERLYAVVRFPLLTELYDGDMFKFKHPQTKVDFTISGKQYELNLIGVGEALALQRLTSLFSKFPDVVFEYKLLGEEPTIEVTEVAASLDFDEEVSSGDTDDTYEEDGSEDSTDGGTDTGFGTPDGTDEEFSGSAENTDKSGDKPECDMIMLPITEIASAVWANGVKVKSIAYIGTLEPRRFEINEEADSSIPLERDICKVIDAMLALSNNIDSSIEALKVADLTTVSQFISKVTQENRGGARVSLTQYVIGKVDDMAKCVPIIIELASLILKHGETVYAYLNVEATDEAAEFVEELAANRKAFRDSHGMSLGYPSEINAAEIADVIIDGSFTERVVVTKGSASIMPDLINKLVAIKISSGGYVIDGERSLADAFEAVIAQNPSNFNAKQLGMVLGGTRDILSETESSTGVKVGDSVYELASMAPWQAMFALLRLNSLITRSKTIKVKCSVNSAVLDYYSTTYRTCEPSLGMSIKSVVNYLNSGILS